MKNFFSRSWLSILLIAVLLSLVMGICSALSAGRISPVSNLINILATPIQKGVSGIGNAIDNYFEKLSDYEKLEKEYKELKKKFSKTEEKLRAAEKAALENEQLRAALDMKARNLSYEFESAEIIARGDNNLSTTFTLDKGSLSGVAVNNCVVTDDGMVGYVSEVGINWCIVTTVIDTGMEASAIVSRTREVASAEGDYELMRDGKFKLSYLEKDTQIVRGDTIETSGFGGLFPKGILIGRVEEIKSEAHGITKYAIMSPVVDLSDIDHVLIIKSFTQTE